MSLINPGTSTLHSVLTQAPTRDLMRRSADFVLEDLPKRGTYLAQSLSNKNIPVLPMLTQHFSNWEYKNFFKLPEVGNLTVTESPMSTLILGLFGFCWGGRIDAAIKRAPVINDPKAVGLPLHHRLNAAGEAIGDDGKKLSLKSQGLKKDYREVRDVLIREGISLSLYLFGYSWLKGKMQKHLEQHGTPFPMPWVKEVPRLSMMHSDGITKPAKMISYLEHEHPYFLGNQDSLVHIAAKTPLNRKYLSAVIAKEMGSFPALNRKPEWKQLLQGFHEQAQEVVTHLNHLDSAIASALEQLQPAHKPFQLQEPVAAIRHSLLTISGLGHSLFARQANSEARLITGLKEVLTQQQQKALQYSEQLSHSHSEASPLKALLGKVRHQLDETTFSELKDFANNKNKAIDKHIKAHVLPNLGDGNRSARAFQKAFDQHWEALHGLVTTLPELHARQQTLHILEGSGQREALLEPLKKAFASSSQAFEAIGKLESELNGQNLRKQLLGPIKAPFSSLKPKALLVRSANMIRTPADWLSLCFVLAAMGLGPVWINKELTNFLYRYHHRNAQNAPSTPEKPSAQNEAQSPNAVAQPSVLPSNSQQLPTRISAPSMPSSIPAFQKVPATTFTLPGKLDSAFSFPSASYPQSSLPFQGLVTPASVPILNTAFLQPQQILLPGQRHS